MQGFESVWIVMNRWALAAVGAFAAGCSSPPAAPREETLLGRLRERSNALASFHYRAELTDGRETVPIELAYRAPDRAVLRYGTGHHVIFEGGVGHFFMKGTASSLDHAAEIGRLRKEYGDPDPSLEAELAFFVGGWEHLRFGQGLRAQLGYERRGARLGWLLDLESFAAEGRTFRRGDVAVELDEHGFIERASVGLRGRLTRLSLSVDEPVDDGVFAPPARERYADPGPRGRELLARSVEDALHRWVIEAGASDAALEALVRADLARRYEPEKMAALLRESLAKSLEAWRRQSPEGNPAVLREKVRIDRGKTLGGVVIMEEEIQKEFERALDRYFRGMARLPAVGFMKDVAARWRAAVARQVDAQIRRPFEAVFAEALKE
jgi:hypothetical protein